MRIDHGVASPGRQFDKQAARRAFDLPRHVRLVLSSGRLAASKNQAALVGAVALVPDIHLAIAGTGPEADNLQALADRLGIRHRLHLVGELPPARIHEFLAAGDAYAFASRTETFGLAVVEAAIAGLPVVSGDLDVLREVLVTAEGAPAAIFVPPDADGIAGGLAGLFADPALASRLASAGQALKERYAPETMCAAYEALLLGDNRGMAAIPSITSSGPERLSVWMRR